MNWTEVRIKTTTQAIDIVSGYLISHGLRGLMIEDAEDFNEFLKDTTIYWDYIDDSLMTLKDCITNIIFYVPDNIQGVETLKSIQSGIGFLPAQTPDVDFGELSFKSDWVREEDWETAWKKYYHTVKLGKHLVICPCWEECELAPDEILVLLDPGMAFGTGTHETTRLCMQFLEDYITTETRLLDIGTGSGILATTALLLGAQSAVGVDIDELAVKIAQENADLNHVGDKITLVCGDLTQKISGKFDVICANIVADVIIRLCNDVTAFMHENTVLIVSGIIEDRCSDVLYALDKAGLCVVAKNAENDWVSVVVRLK